MKPLNFLWLAGIRGDSQDPRHIGDFNVLRYTWGIDTGSIAIRSGFELGTGKVTAQVGDFNFVVKNDTHEFHQLLLAVFESHRIQTAILTSEKNMGGLSAGLLIRFVMRDIFLESIKSVTVITEYGPPVPNSSFITLNCKSLDIYQPS